jgi:hypothetical protein
LSSRAEYGFDSVRARKGGRRGVYGFSSLVKQNKKAEICFVIYIAGFFFLKFFCYEVIVKQKIYKRSSNYYYCVDRTRAFDNDYDLDMHQPGD